MDPTGSSAHRREIEALLTQINELCIPNQTMEILNHLINLHSMSPATTSHEINNYSSSDTILLDKAMNINSQNNRPTKMETIRLSAILYKILYNNIEKYDKDSDLMKVLRCYVLKEETVRKLRNEDLVRPQDITSDLLALKSLCLSRHDLFTNVVYLKTLLSLLDYSNLRIQASLLRQPNFMDTPTIPSSTDLQSLLSIEREKELVSLTMNRPVLFTLVGSSKVDSTSMRISSEAASVSIISGVIIDSRSSDSFYMECTVEGENVSFCRIGITEQTAPILTADDILSCNCSCWTISESAFYSQENKLAALAESLATSAAIAESLLPSTSDVIIQEAFPSSMEDRSFLDEDNLFSNIFDARSVLSSHSVSRKKKISSQGGVVFDEELKWRSGDVIGVLVLKIENSITFTINGVPRFSGNLTSMANLIPVFICAAGCSLLFNIGQRNFLFPPATSHKSLISTFKPSYLRLGQNGLPGTVRWKVNGDIPSSFSVELAIFVESFPSTDEVVFSWGTFSLQLSNSGQILALHSSQVTNDCGTIGLRTWCFLAMTYTKDTSKLQFFINSTSTALHDIPDIKLSPSILFGGGGVDGTTSSFSVVVSFIRIWSNALPIDQICRLEGRNSFLDVSPSILLSALIFDEQSTAQIYDRVKYVKHKECCGVLYGQFEWVSIPETNATFSMPLSIDCKSRAQIVASNVCEWYDAVRISEDFEILQKAMADLSLSLFTGAVNYNESSSFSREFKCKSVAIQAFIAPGYQTFMLLQSCLQHLHRLEETKKNDRMFAGISASLLAVVQSNLIAFTEMKLSASSVGIAYSLVPSTEYKNNLFVTSFLYTLLSFCESNSSSCAVSIISSSLNIFFPFLSDQIYLLSLLIDPSEAVSALGDKGLSISPPPLVEYVLKLTSNSRASLLKGIADSLSEEKKLQSLLRGIPKPPFINPKTFLTPDAMPRGVPLNDVIPQFYDVVSLRDPAKYGETDGLGMIIDIIVYDNSRGVLVLWKSGKKNSYLCEDLLVYRNQASYTDYNAPYVDVVNSNPVYRLEDVQKSLLYGLGQYSKDDVLKYLRTYSSSDFKHKYKLDQHISKLKAKFSAKEVCILFEKYCDVSEKSCSNPSSVFGITVPITCDKIVTLLLANCSSIDNVIEPPCLRLLFSIQACLTGMVGNLNGGRIMLPDDRKFSDSSVFTCDNSDRNMSFSVSEETWLSNECNSPKNDKEKGITVLTHLRIDTRSCADRLVITPDRREVSQSVNRSWKSCLGNTALLPNTGVYKWFVLLENLSSSHRGICIFGVAEANFDCEFYLGQDSHSWGLTSSRETFHGGSQTSSESLFKITQGMVLCCTLDTDKGEFYIANGIDISTTQKIFSGLKGRTLHPAFSLFALGDAIKILTKDPSVNDLLTTLPLEKRQYYLGPPSSSLLNLSMQLVRCIREYQHVELPLKLFKLPVLKYCFPSLISALLQYQFTSHQSCQLIPSLVELLDLLLGSISEVKVQSAIDVKSIEESSESILFFTHASSLLAAYIGRLCGDLIAGSHYFADNLLLLSELGSCAADNIDFSPLVSTNWHYRSLFDGGILSISNENYYDLWTTDVFVLEWISRSSTSHSSLKALGGTALNSTIGCIFSSVAYHIGLIGCIELLRDSIKCNSNQHLIEKTPPSFLITLWSMCESMKSYIDVSSAIDDQARVLMARAVFLFNFAPRYRGNLICEDVVKAFIHDNKPIPANVSLASNFISANKDTISLIRSFLFDSYPLVKINIHLRVSEKVACGKTEGFRAIRSALAIAGSRPLIKSSLLIHASDGVRSIKGPGFFHSNPFFPPNSIVSKDCRGYYKEGTFGCSPAESSALKGSFVSFYEFLTDEFDSISGGSDHDLIFILLNNLSIVVHQDDHDLLAKVDIFHKLHSVIDVPLTRSANDANLTKTALKTFFLLTFQVAFTPEHPRSILSAPVLSRTVSGPASLTKSVFDIVFQLIQNMTTDVKSLLTELPESGFIKGNCVIQLDSGFDHNSFIDEIATLLLQLCKSSICLKLLSTPLWLITLFDCCIHSTSNCQFRLLQVLSYVAPRVNPATIESSKIVFPFLKYCMGSTAESTSAVEGLIEIIIFLCSKTYSASSFGLILSQREKLSDLAGSIASISAEAETLFRFLLCPDSLWAQPVESILIESLLTFNKSFSKTSIIKKLCISSILGGDSLIPRRGSFCKDLDGEIYDILSVYDNGVMFRVIPVMGDPSVEETKSSDDVELLSRCPLEVTRLSDTVISAVMTAFFDYLSLNYRLIHVEESGDSLRNEDAWLLELLTMRIIKAMTTIYLTFSDAANVFQRHLNDSDLSRPLSNLMNIAVTEVDTEWKGASEEFQNNSKVAVISKGRNILFMGEIENIQADGSYDLVYSNDSKEIAVKKEWVCNADGPFPTCRLMKSSVNHAGVIDIQGIEELLSVSVIGLHRFSLDKYVKVDKRGSVELPIQPSVSKVPELQGDMISWMRNATSERKADAPVNRIRRSDSNDEKIDQLIQLGFLRSWAQVALDLNGGDFELALNYILNNSESLQNMNHDEEQFEEDYSETEAEEFMRQLDRLNSEDRKPPVNNPTSQPVLNASPPEFHYDDMKLTIIPLYESPSLDSEKVGSLFPSDSLYALEELVLGERNHWLKVLLSDYDDEYEQAGENAYVWVPRFIDGVEVIFPGCASESAPNLADPPALTYSHDSKYLVIGKEGVILREGVDLTSSRELQVIPCETLLRCDKETINSDGTLRLHVIDPYIGWISKKRHLVQRQFSQQADETNVTSNSVSSKTELELLFDMTEKSEFSCGDEKLNRDNRFFDCMQGTQYQRYIKDIQSRDHILESRNRVSNCGTVAMLSLDISNRSKEAVDESILNTSLALSTLYARNFLVWMFSLQSSAQYTKLIFDAFTRNLYPLYDVDIKATTAVIQRFIRFILFTSFNKSSSIYSSQNSFLINLGLSFHMPSFETKLLLHLSNYLHLCESDSSFKKLFQEKMASCFLLELARQVRLACTSGYSDHMWTDDTSKQVILDSEMLIRPSMRFAEWITALLVDIKNTSKIITVFKIWLAALKSSNLSLKHLSLILLRKIFERLQYEASTASFELKDEYSDALNMCLKEFPLRSLREETGKRLWMENEDYPLYSRYLQAMMELLLLVSKFPGGSEIVLPTAEKKIEGKHVLQFSPCSSLKLPTCRDISGSWTVEFWLRRYKEADSDLMYDEPIYMTAVPPPATPAHQEEEFKDDASNSHDSDYSEDVDFKASPSFLKSEGKFSDVPGEHLRNAGEMAGIRYQHRPLVLLSSNSGTVKLQTGGNVLSEEDDPYQDIDFVNDSAFCMSVSYGNSEKVLDFVVPCEEWIHLALSYSTKTSSLSLIVNGEQVDEVIFNRLCLPLGAVGALQGTAHKSFTGELAMMRVWNYSKTSCEIKRDMSKKTPGYKGLLSSVMLGEGQGDEVEDHGDTNKICKVVGCDWKVSATAPILAEDDVPPFALQDLEESEGIFGDLIGNANGVVEVTGILRREGFSETEEPFSSEFSEVVTLCYKTTESSSRIHGYLEWCGRNYLRSLVVGTIDDSKLEFSTSSSKVIYGSPASLSWLNNLVFRGIINDSHIEGELEIDVAVPRIPSLSEGRVRLDKRRLCRHLKISNSSLSYDEGQLNSFDDPVSGLHVCTVEVHPYNLNDDQKRCFFASSGSLWIEWKVGGCGSESR